jgi:hypothetical protein
MTACFTLWGEGCHHVAVEASRFISTDLHPVRPHYDLRVAMELQEFEAQLRELTGTDPLVRPFVCDGSPLTCAAFVVGTNPATEVPFWPFWDASYGFRKADWRKAYEQARIAKQETGPSPTRRMIEKLVEVAAPTRCLETNVYSKPSPSSAELKRGDRQTRIFGFLLRAIQPKAVLLHGQHARDHFEQAYGAKLSVGLPKTIMLRNGTVRVLATHHLSYQGSYERAAESGRWLASQSGVP